MRGKKGRFGYLSGLSRLMPRRTNEWFDPSLIWLRGEATLSEEEEARPTFWAGRIIMLVLGLLLLWRLTNLQIIQGNAHLFMAEGNRVRRQVTLAPRGLIVDRNGVPLATNEPGYALSIVMSELPGNRSQRARVLANVADSQHLPVEELQKKMNKSLVTAYDPIIIQPNLSREQALLYQIRFAAAPGVHVSYMPKRRYNTTLGLSHILGYTADMTEKDRANHPDYYKVSPIGRSGVEASYDHVLRGKEGASEIEIDAVGRPQRVLSETASKVGDTLRLTLDMGLEQETASALLESMQKSGAKHAAAVAMDPKTGGILASVSLPHYDNNVFSGGITSDDYKRLVNDSNRPLLNRTVDGQYSPGSTFKPFVAAAALQEGTISDKTLVDTSVGVIEIGQWRFPDWKTHGLTDVRRAIAESNNIFFYSIGGGWEKVPGLGSERIKKYAHIFGLGQSTGLDYESDASGLIPDPDWKKKIKKETWYIGDTYHMAIGQGDVLATPLQMARGISAIANGGRLLTPHIAAATESPDTSVVTPLTFPESIIPVSPQVLAVIREGMRQTVAADYGSAKALRSLPFSSAGKTGTAQFGTEDKTHAWYVGFAPYENPEIVVAIVVEGAGGGSTYSVPVASRMLSYYMSHR